MNANTKTKLSNFITLAVAVIAAVQTSLTSPPLTAHDVLIATSFLGLASLILTPLKQYLSAEVNNKAAQTTLLIALIPTLTVLANLVNIFHYSANAAVDEHVKTLIAYWISIAAMCVTVVAKTLFPSGFQKDKNQELKTIDQSKTQ